MKKNKTKSDSKEANDSTACNDKKCPYHGELSMRGRAFEGKITKVVNGNATIEVQRFVRLPKYERYAKAKTKLHAHIPKCIISSVKTGDTASIMECRPLSRTIHHVLLKKAEGESK